MGLIAKLNLAGLRAKFNLVILAAFAIGFLVAAIVLQRVFADNAREQVLQNARIMMTAANAIRSYTSSELVPLLPLERDGKFVAETVPAYAAQRNFRAFRDVFAGYSYKEPTLNPTNLADRAQDWESDIINKFRNDTQQQELVTERETATGLLMHLARPIVIRGETCLGCHSAPSVAPAALIRTYGSAHGFGWKLDETVGAQIVTVPMDVAFKLAREAYFKFLIILVGVFALIFVVLNLLLHYLVIKPVKKVSAIADRVSLGDEHAEVYVKPGRDEISSLSVSFNRMRESLKHAMEMLK